ncbi:MAG TPA: ATPase, T2SS/T4P/T4SS family, partial [Candidatus Limnocylindrales bacterium]|nr:ATPase, T2SS/T4P/T4SS family [Candidatus Limnocylindrales bacterium]
MSLLERQRAAQAALANQPADAPDAPFAPSDGIPPVARPWMPGEIAPPSEQASSDGTATASVPATLDGAANRAVAVPGSNLPAVIPKETAKAATPRSRTAAREDLFQEIRVLLQREVIGAFDSLLDGEPGTMNAKVEGIVDRVITANNFAVTRDERGRLVEEMVHEITGFGPLEPYLNDPTITEVMVNGPNNIYIERAGKISKVDAYFLNDEHVHRIIDRIITPLGRRIDETSPRVDARLPDGSRVNAIIAPLSLVGPVITVRKFSRTPYTVDDLIRFGTSTPDMFEFLRACIEARLNIFVSGGTGSGKTTTLNVLSSFIPNDERIVTIEDAAELQLRQEHVITLESRPPNLEGEGEITIRHLLRNAMHMRPDRIIVGECRAGEALDMLQAMTTGHDGSLSTGHANSPKDMLRRLETMVLMAGYELPLRAIREQISSAVDLIVHTARLKDGTRKIVNITEIYGIEDDEILTQDIFVFQQTAFKDGRIEGELRPTGFRPTFMAQFKTSGVELPPGEFGIPPEGKAKPTPIRVLKGRWSLGQTAQASAAAVPLGHGRAVKAGGMVYISSMGPVDPESGHVVHGGVKEHTRQSLANLKAKLEGEGTSLDKVVWASWALRDPGDFDMFNEEWLRWFPGDGPIGQGTLMPPLHRRAGFRVSIGVI